MVPVVDLSRRGSASADQLAAAVAAVARRGQLLLGPETEGFEAELASWLGAPQAVAVSSGASALQLALAAVGVAAGDEVIVPAFTAVPTASAICALGAVPVPVDVERATACLDGGAAAAAVTPRRAVVVVHLYGREATLPDTDLPIVEDVAQAHGAVERHDRSAAVAYSFYPTKNLGGIGDGGAVVTADPDVASRTRLLRVQGMSAQYVHDEISQNFRMSEVEAAWLRIALGSLEAGNRRRRAVARRYRTAAPHLDWHADHDRHVHHLAVFRTFERDRVRAELAQLGVATAVHYPLALTQQPAYRCFARHACPEAEAWAASCVTVPCFPELTDDEVEHVADALARIDAPVAAGRASR